MTAKICETHRMSTAAAIFTSGANWLFSSPAIWCAPCASSAATFCGSRVRLWRMPGISSEVTPVATLSTWLTTTVGLSTDSTLVAELSASAGVEARGATCPVSVFAFAASVCTSGAEAGRLSESPPASVFAVSAISTAAVKAPARSDCPARVRTSPALCSAEPTGADMSWPFAAGFAAPEPRRSVSGARVVAIDRAVDATWSMSTVGAVSCCPRVATSVPSAGRSASEKSEVKAVASCVLPRGVAVASPAPALASLLRIDPSEPSSGLDPFSIEQYRSPGSQIEATRPDRAPIPCGRGSAMPCPEVRGPTVAVPFVPAPGSASSPTASTRLASTGPGRCRWRRQCRRQHRRL